MVLGRPMEYCQTSAHKQKIADATRPGCDQTGIFKLLYEQIDQREKQNKLYKNRCVVVARTIAADDQ